MTIQHFFSISLLIASLAACVASMPTQEMSDARQAMQTAKNANAAVYLPDYLTQIEEALLEAEQALSDGDYEKARSIADTAKQQAISARHMSIVIAQAEAMCERLIELDSPPSQTTLALNHLLVQAKASAQFGEVEQVLKLTEEILQRGELLKARLEAEQDN